jgi:serine/threonine protein kinase
MTLENGQMIGPYEVEAPAGAGGMGEIYKARDTRLDRTVAIKVLPAKTADDADFRARFEREAKAISSLNHPNICILYDIGRENGTDYLVMEYIEGEPLSERLKKGPLAVDEAIDIAIQIADALDKAHRQGLIHRDLKPANVMLTRDGAKLLDFGLAKFQISNGNGNVEGLTGVTHTAPLTGAGSIVGTMQYMSPEQLEGQPADHCSDIFAFGAMLYEMLTGQRAFEGKSQASLIASILSKEPTPIASIRPMFPPGLDRLVRKCLEKDPRDRWQSASDLCDELRWIQKSGSQAGIPVQVSRRRRFRFRLAWLIAIITGLTAVVLAGKIFLEPQPVPAVRKFKIGLGEEIKNANWSRISPDGKLLAIRAIDSLGHSSIWIRPMNSLDAYPLAGTDGAGRPFWSPDSRYLAYFINNQLKKVPASGGPVQLICEVNGYDGSWGSSGIILFDNSAGDSIRQVSASGGIASAATKINRDRNEQTHAWPCFLPDGKHFLYLADIDTSLQAVGTYMVCVGSADDDLDKQLFPVDSRIEYSKAGYIIYWSDGVLFAHPFDAKKLEAVGEAIPIAENVSIFRNAALFSISDEGTLAYQIGSDMGLSQLLWLDRSGNVIDTVGVAGYYSDIALSPDGNRLAYEVTDPQIQAEDIWVYDLVRNVPSRLTFEESNEVWPIWSPDGSSIIYASNKNGHFELMERQANGLGEPKLIFSAKGETGPSDWSRDGKTIILGNFQDNWNIWLLNAQDSGQYEPLTSAPYTERKGRISPNGRFIAYQSNESGRAEIYVRDLRGSGGKWQVSADGGFSPCWRSDGKELYYSNQNWNLMAVSVSTDQDSFQAGVPEKLFNRRYNSTGIVQNRYVAADDGQRFLMNVPISEPGKSEIVVVLNWDSELDKP